MQCAPLQGTLRCREELRGLLGDELCRIDRIHVGYVGHAGGAFLDILVPLQQGAQVPHPIGRKALKGRPRGSCCRILVSCALTCLQVGGKELAQKAHVHRAGHGDGGDVAVGG